jgi:hypothetical protein
MKFKFAHLWIFIGAFMGFIVFLVISSASQKIDLETENYYEEEIAYQDVIDDSRNYNNLNDTLQIVANSGLMVMFPDLFVPSLVQGNAIVRCNADASADFREAIKLQENGTFVIPPAHFQRSGWYRLKLQWTYQGKSYFKEAEILIEK